MEYDEMTMKLAETEARSKSNTHRIDKLEQGQEALNSLAQSVAVMAKEQEHIRTEVSDTKSAVQDIQESFAGLAAMNEIKKDVAELKAKPGKRWESLVEKALAAVVGGVIAWLLAGVLR